MYLCIPSCLAKAATPINEQNYVEGPVASQWLRRCQSFTSNHVAILVLQPFNRPFVCALSCSFGFVRDEFHTLLGASIAILGAMRPLSPITEIAILLAGLVFTRDCL
jgi:hypothetical protein